jgi:diguanylate cyclase (GGDEF)-like protein
MYLMAVTTSSFSRLRHAAAPYLRRAVLLRLALFLAVSLTLVWSVVALERAQLTRIAQQESHRIVRNLAHAFSEEIGATVGSVDLALIGIRAHWSENRAGFERIVADFNRQLSSKVIMHLAVADTKGILQYTTAGPFARGIDLSDRAHIRFFLEGGPDRLYISDPLIGRATGILSVQFARPIYDRNGTLAGVIVASVAPRFFTRFYDSIDLGKDSSMALVHDGVVLARTSTRHVDDTGKRLTGYPYDATSEIAGTFRRVSRLDGVERFYGWRRLPSYDLVVTVGQSVDAAHLRYARQLENVNAMGAVLSLVLLVLGWGVITSSYIRKRAQKALAATEERWKLALDAEGAGVWDWNVETGTVEFTPRAQELLRIPAASMNWRFDALNGRIHPEDLPAVERALRELLDATTEDLLVEFRVMGPDGENWISERAGVVERSDSGRPVRVVGTVTNIDKRMAQQMQMRHLATHDTLTGLANRALFNDRLQQALLMAQRESRSLGVLYFDLDKFKPVNDTHGHAVGDRLLVQVAERIRSTLRQSDTLARLGGDEFAVLLPNCACAADAVKVGEHVLDLLNQPFEVDGLVLHISGSIGAAVYPECGADAAQLVNAADQAMYQSKQQGRGRVTLSGAAGRT